MILYVLLIFFTVAEVYADTPANCTYDDIVGTWYFYEGERSSKSSINCTDFSGPTVYSLKLQLLFPNVVADELGHTGYWTMVYNQGFEVVINYRKYFAFSKYRKTGPNITSLCDSTSPGWSHDVLGKNWACYNARKGKPLQLKVHLQPKIVGKEKYFIQSSEFIQKINSIQKSWVATSYPKLNFFVKNEDVVKRFGGIMSQRHQRISPAPVTSFVRKISLSLPQAFDWRDVDGVNYVSPVRSQGSCGSCYAFSSLAMLEARLRIATNNSLQVQFSPQDIVSCSEYSQGCEGGYPYVIAGKYAQDFGVVPEECNPYVGKDGPCAGKKCKRYYVAKYNYVGGFYGGCNEDLMKLDLVKNGPITVAFEVYPDFQFYRNGIYHHTGLRDRFNPFQLVNHGVLITGYGVDDATGEKYWIVKNSWGTEWGESGYFKIRRGTNECSIESEAVSSIPIP